jgi:hypothetical protein
MMRKSHHQKMAWRSCWKNIDNDLMQEYHPILVPHEPHILPMRAFDNDCTLLFYTYPQGYQELGSTAPNCTHNAPATPARTST